MSRVGVCWKEQNTITTLWNKILGETRQVQIQLLSKIALWNMMSTIHLATLKCTENIEKTIILLQLFLYKPPFSIVTNLTRPCNMQFMPCLVCLVDSLMTIWCRYFRLQIANIYREFKCDSRSATAQPATTSTLKIPLFCKIILDIF